MLKICVEWNVFSSTYILWKMIIYIGNSKVSNKKLLDLVNEFNKVEGYKVNIQRPVAFL